LAVGKPKCDFWDMDIEQTGVMHLSRL
jgi:hypothetical protein